MTNTKTFRPGDRVQATVYGIHKAGSVRRSANGIAFIVWDGEQRESWMHTESLRLDDGRLPGDHPTSEG